MILTLLTDYGAEDEFVGVLHSVIARICPDCRIVDITHGVPRHAVRHAAVLLRNALPYAPAGVHVAVVDPEVGTERRALALECDDGRLLVGPDNGVLSLAWERFGGVVEAVDVSRSRHRLEPVSATFHGRDLFAPVAAALAAGAPLTDAGERIDPDELTTIALPAATVAGRTVTARAIVVDRFGNVALNLDHEGLAGTGLVLGHEVELEVAGTRHRAAFARSFADVDPGELLVYEDAYRSVALAVNRGDAAALLDVAPDDEVRLTPL